MKIEELKVKTKSELNDLLHAQREKLRELRFDLVSGRVKNVREIREIRKDIAKMLTLLNSKTESK